MPSLADMSEPRPKWPTLAGEYLAWASDRATSALRSVNFAGHPRLIGQFVDVLITEAMSNSLRGRVHSGESVALA